MISIVVNKKLLDEYDPLNDYLFSRYMAEKGCEETLLSFLNAIFGKIDKNINHVEIKNNKSIISQSVDTKDCYMDLRAIADDDIGIIVEMQQRDANEFRKKALHYLCGEYYYSVGKGKKQSCNPHYLINILNFKFCNDKNYYENFNILELTNNICNFEEIINIINFNLFKFKKYIKIDLENPLHRWGVFFLKNRFKKEFREVLKMDKAINMTDEKIRKILSDDEEERLYLRAILKKHEIEEEIRDAEIKGKDKGKIEGKEEGKIEGMIEGKEEEKIKIAIKLKKQGMNFDKIAEITDLTINDIKEL